MVMRKMPGVWDVAEKMRAAWDNIRGVAKPAAAPQLVPVPLTHPAGVEQPFRDCRSG